MRILVFVFLLLNIPVVSAQVLLKQEPADPDHYIVAFNTTATANKKAMRDSDSRHAYMRALKQQVANNVKQLMSDLDGTDLQVTSSMWLIQSAAIQISPRFLDKLEALPYVKEVRPDTKYSVESQGTLLSDGVTIAADGIARVDIDSLWSEGYKGQGVVVAILDTGVDVRHKDLKNRWRGGTNSWYDPNDETSVTPTDTGHGTSVASIVLGGNDHAGGDYLGVAPEATWIAARVIDSVIVESDIHKVFEWVLNPDGNDLTDDYPDIVQNSWAFGTSVGVLCLNAYPFSTDFQQLNLWNIDIVFSVGNSTGTSSYFIPANDPNVISVGSVDKSDVLSSSSGQGPDLCSASKQIPSLVAPGEVIHVADIANSYTFQSGTSFASPMVTGALALLRSKYKANDFMDYRRALFESTSLIGNTGRGMPNDQYGYGLVQASAAADKLASYANVALVDNEVNFSFAVLAPVETDGIVSVTLLRSGDVSGTPTVRVTTASGTATQGLDFESFDNFVQFSAGETKKVIDITLIDDNESEGTENLTVQLTTDLTVASTKNSQITINITDDELPPTLDQVGGASFTVRYILILMALLIASVTARRYSAGHRI
jgi:subtilisin family serine protease